MSVLTAFVQSAGFRRRAFEKGAQSRASLEAELPDEDLETRGETGQQGTPRAATECRGPSGPRWLCTSAVAITASFWAMVVAPPLLPPETMIKEYMLTDCVSVKLDGKPWTVVTPIGWGFLAVFAGGCVGLWGFGRWARARAKKLPSDPEKAGGGGRGIPRATVKRANVIY